MPPSDAKPRSHFTDVARLAAQAARAAKRAEPDTFGVLKLFIVKAGDHAFTWELRRFGGVLLEREIETFPSQALARTDDEAVLATVCASPDLPRFKRALR